jgi:ABC-type glycerol-3-phosphate transport system permease component
MAMVAGGRWKRWVFLYLPLGAFVLITLFPFYYMAVTSLRPDREMYIPWNRPNFAPFWTLQPTLEHFSLLFRETLFLRWLLNTLIISVLSTGIALFCGLLAAYALLFLSSATHKTVPVDLVSGLVRGDTFFWGPLMAGALLGSVPVAFIYSFFVENYVSAMTGAVKG